jgi:DNA polymerase-1
MSEKILLLVDGSSYLYRAYHAMPDLRGPEGVPTGAIHGMVNMMNWLREHIGAEHAACVFDAKGPTFRDDWYPEYKAQRAPMPDDLRSQIAPIHEVVKLLGWPVIEVPGIEADDAIGTLARMGEASGHKVVISTGDKDLAQLVTDQVSLINTMAKPPEVLDVAGVKAKFGVPPNRIIDYLTLIGDTVDNVPGVEKVGPKTAVKWLEEHDSLDGVVAAAEQIKGVAGENLRKALDWLPTGRKLITVVTDCDLDGHVPAWPALDALALKDVDATGLLAFYTRFGFKSGKRELEAKLQQDDTAAAAPSLFDAAPLAEASTPLAREYETISTLERLDAWITQLRAAPLVALDTETDSLDAMVARIVGISFATEPGKAAYVPVAHNYPGAPDQLSLDAVLARLQPWLEDAQAPKLGQHIKYDSHVLANHGIAVRGFVHDTLLESYVLEAHKPHSLESLAERHLGRKGLSYEDLCGKGVNQIGFSQVDIDQATTYSGEDSEMCLQVHQTLWPQIEADAKLRYVYEQIEMPVVPILMRIERTGVLIDAAKLAAQSQQLAERMLALEQEAFEIAGQPFNMGSPKQVGEICLASWACRSRRRRPAVHRRPTRKCCRNWPPTTRFPRAYWNTAAWPS